jgi:hypothetical protein
VSDLRQAEGFPEKIRDLSYLFPEYGVGRQTAWRHQIKLVKTDPLGAKYQR